MKTKAIRKLLMSSFTAFLLAISLFSTTYAFVVLYQEAEVEEIDFEIEQSEGLLIGLDENFSNDISNQAITSKILENVNANSTKNYTSFSEIAFKQVTIAHDENAIETINYTDSINNASIRPKFLADELIASPTAEDDIAQAHQYRDASGDEYIWFDLYFKMTSVGDFTGKTYNLKFSDRTKLESQAQTVTLLNKAVSGDTTYNSGDEVAVNQLNAMRIGVYSNNSLKVFEPYQGHASAAITGATDALHDPAKNLMYTYYNSINVVSQFTEAAIGLDGLNYNTITSFTTPVLGTFTYNENSKSYNEIKLTVMIWLEGWDADYIEGMATDTIKALLGFEIVAVE